MVPLKHVRDHDVLRGLQAIGRTADRLRPIPSPLGTNLLFAAERHRGAESLVKVYRSASAAARETAALRLAEPLAPAAVVPSVESVFLLSVAEAELAAAEYSFLPGAPLPETGHPEECDLANLGRALAALHQLPVRDCFGDLLDIDGVQGWWDVLSIRVDRGRRLVEDSLLPVAVLTRVRERLAGAAAALHCRPSLLHADLNRSNLLTRPDGGWALVDFERALLGHWLYDLVKLFRSLVGGCASCLASFFDGYGRVLSPEESDLFDLYAAIHSIDLAAYLARAGRGPQDRHDLDGLLDYLKRAS